MPAPFHRVSPSAGAATTTETRFGRLAASGNLARAAITTLALCSASLLAGCTIPSDCGDLDYPTYGGAWQRTRRDSGRVGSVFDPAGARSATLVQRDQEDDPENVRSPREGIHSTPPSAPSTSGEGAIDDPAEPSPADRFDPERLRSLDLDEISIQPGAPAPPDLY